MIPQYVAASIVSRNKQLCTPASVDSIVSSNGQEDHVSMGAQRRDEADGRDRERLRGAGDRAVHRRPGAGVPAAEPELGHIERVMAAYREVVPFLKSDDVMYEHMAATKAFVKRTRFGPSPDVVDDLAADAEQRESGEMTMDADEPAERSVDDIHGDRCALAIRGRGRDARTAT